MAKAATPSASAPQPPYKYRWLFKLIAVSLPLVAFLLLELALRMFGFGYPTGFLVEKEIQGKPKLADNRQFAWRFFPPSIARTPDPILVDAVKPLGTVRVVVFGESAAMGDPEPALGFARMLEVLLREAYPDTKIEVINAACTAINSHAILPIARDCEKLQADFWVIYMGNNEIVGPYGAGTVFGIPGASLGLIRGSLWCKSLKLAQLLDKVRGVSTVVKEDWKGMEMFLDKQVRHDDPKMPRVYHAFERNLQDILRAGKNSGAKTLVCTVASNLKDCAPFASMHRAGLTQQADWDAKVKAGAGLAASGHHEEALKDFDAALKMDDQFAELHFRIGQSQYALGQTEQARKSFKQALELDTLRFRTDSQLNKILRDTARGRTNEGIYLLDVEAMLNEGNAIAGKELFWEHVHFNVAGNYRLAQIIAGQLAAVWPGSKTAKQWLSIDRTAQHLAFTDWNQNKLLQEMRKRLDRPPFTMQLGHAQQVEEYAKQSQELEQRQTEDALRAGIAFCRAAVTAWPDNWRLVSNLAEMLQEAGDTAGAAAQFQRVTELLPHHAGAYFFCGRALYNAGKIDDAMKWYFKTLEVKPDSSEVWNELGVCYYSMNRIDEALNYCRLALRQNPEDSSYHYNFGIMLAKQGKMEEAEKEYRRALELTPSYSAAAIKLGNLLANQGKFAAEEEFFKTYLNKYPDDIEVRHNYGGILGQQGRFAEAQAQIGMVLQRKPNHVEARYNLATTYMSQKRYADAIAEYEKIRALRPGWPLAEQAIETARRKARGE
jgi:tetratricopeptide (TPR) repeat protein